MEVTANLQINPCATGGTVKLVSIKSSDKDSGAGPGEVPKDIQQASFGTNDHKFLCARSASTAPAPGIITKKKRTYTVTYQVKDASNNTKTVAGTVTVP